MKVGDKITRIIYYLYLDEYEYHNFVIERLTKTTAILNNGTIILTNKTFDKYDNKCYKNKRIFPTDGEKFYTKTETLNKIK